MANPLYLNANGSLDPSITDFFAAYSSDTIASGSVTMTASAMQIDTPGGAADDLDTIVASNAEAGTALFIRSTSPDRVVTLKHLTGNIYSAGGDVILNDPQQLIMLVYSGTYWVVMNGSGAAAPILVTETSGQNRRCVIAERVKVYLRYALSQAAAVSAGGVLPVTAALLDVLRLAQPNVDPAVIAATAADLVAIYEDEAAMLLAFNDGFWDDVRCALYCGHASNATLFTAASVSAIRDRLVGYFGVEYAAISTIIGQIGPDGLTRAVGLHTFTLTLADCAEDCGCDAPWCQEFDFSASDGGWDTLTLSVGFTPRFLREYTSGAWRDSAHETVGDPGLITRGVAITRDFTSTRITHIQVTYDKVNGSFAWDGQPRRMAIIAENGGAIMLDTGLLGSETDGTDKVLGWTGDLLLDRISLHNESRYAVSGANGSVVVKGVRIEGVGVNPFGASNCGGIGDDQLSLIPNADAPDTLIEYLGANRWRVTGHVNGSTDRRFGFEDAFGRCINISTIHTQSDVFFRAFTNCAGTYSAGGGVLNTGSYRTGVWTNLIGGANPTAEFTAFAS